MARRLHQRLHADAFGTRVFGESEWNWTALTARHSLGWVVARDGTDLVGFVNVHTDGLVHARLQDTMVASRARGRGVGRGGRAEAAGLLRRMPDPAGGRVARVRLTGDGERERERQAADGLATIGQNIVGRFES